MPGNEKEGIQKIMEENDLAAKGFHVDEISWLKRPDKPLGGYASIGIWLSTPDAAEWIMKTGCYLDRDMYVALNIIRLKGTDTTGVRDLTAT
jgi:hypothetical protein